ncbi:MAG: toprim domain-containing protein [Burkholderiales bacterium]|nr:toprim domain-containing protein [Burkholderiales bacterium]
MDRLFLDRLKHRIGLLDYLRHHGWEPSQQSGDAEVAGLCPLHSETKPSFWIHTRKNLFYCHGCGSGGDLIRLAQLHRGYSFPQAIVYLRSQLEGGGDIAGDTIAFYRAQLHRWPEAMQYLASRGIHSPAVLDAMQIGYAPGACLRQHLQQLGYPFEQMRSTGLLDRHGRDAFYRRIVFPFGATFYGRNIDSAATAPHRFPQAAKGGLYRWDRLQPAPAIILVEGLFDVAALWQAGFEHATCGGGAHLNRTQWEQLTAGSRTVWIALDGDAAGQQAAARLSARLQASGQRVRRIPLPGAHDPASYFAAGASPAQWRHLMELARP